jgi:hypothetical protein
MHNGGKEVTRSNIAWNIRQYRNKLVKHEWKESPDFQESCLRLSANNCECSHISLAVVVHLAEGQTLWVEWMLNLEKSKLFHKSTKVNNFQE